MAIEAGDFKTGLTLLIDGDPWVVVDFMHVKPGKGAAFLNTKMKNLRNGKTLEKNYNASTRFDAAEIIKKRSSYTYEAGGIYYFMDVDTYETYELNEEQMGFNKYFILEGAEVLLVFFQGEVLNVALPDKVDLVIAETSPAIKGDSTATKDAVTNTGLKIRVPLFIEEGEKVTVMTADGTYSGRAK